LLWCEGCPSTPEAIELVREELDALQLDPDELRITEIRTDDEAERERFVGSPTIRIDGHDVQPPDDEPVGLTCRVYRWRDGRVAPLPERAEVREALLRAKGGR
jgi:hypothetical protein